MTRAGTAFHWKEKREIIANIKYELKLWLPHKVKLQTPVCENRNGKQKKLTSNIECKNDFEKQTK